MNNSGLSEVDLKELVHLAASDATAKIIFNSFANRQNSMTATTVTSLHSTLRYAGFEVSRDNIKRVFRKLQEFNCGQFILGKIHGPADTQSRFVWKLSLVILGRAVLRGLAAKQMRSDSFGDTSFKTEVKAWKVARWVRSHIAQLRMN